LSRCAGDTDRDLFLTRDLIAFTSSEFRLALSGITPVGKTFRRFLLKGGPARRFLLDFSLEVTPARGIL
jgi:hypothetical protein